MAQRHATVTTPLGDKLLLRRMTGHEELGRLFQYDVELLSDTDDIKPSALLAQLMTVHLELPSGELRHFQGHVSRFARAGRERRFVVHRATLRPWLWLLSRAVNCRIFQNMSVPDVLRKVFRSYGFAHFEDQLRRSYPVREIVVQYRESDLDFVSRLMEEQGIYYFFRHAPDAHSLVLVDDLVTHDPMPGYDEVPYYPPNTRVEEHFDHWSSSAEVQSGRYVLDDYDFEAPAADLLVERTDPGDHEQADLARYEYPGGYDDVSAGDALVRVRLEEQQAEHERFEGDAVCRGLSAGYTFKLGKHPREDQNKSYLVISARHSVTSEHYESEAMAGAEEFRCSVTAIDSQVPFRPRRTTPRPRMSGPQTAVVVGATGQELWTDEHGRVRLQFHWDREGKSNEQSTCWVRVAQIWAGGGFGAQFIPRVGQEVIVDFLGGDPDRPIVVGSVYNGFNHPPFTLPQNQTQSGIKTQSTQGGNTSTANVIRFEDKMGSEHLFIQAEKDKEVLVKADRKSTIGGSDTLGIANDRDKKVGQNETIEVGANRQATIGGNETTTVTGNQVTTVAGDVAETVAGNVTQTVAGSVTETIAGSRTETIAGAVTQTAAGGVNINTPAAVTISAVGGVTIVAPGGMKTIDSFFDKTGGFYADAFGSKTSVLGGKADFVAGLAYALINNKVDMVGLKVDMARTKISSQNQVTLKSYGTAIMQGYVNLHTCGLVVIQ